MKVGVAVEVAVDELEDEVEVVVLIDPITLPLDSSL